MGNYENIRLEKGMYGQGGQSFTQTLETLDPSQRYAGTPLETLDAYQRQLKRFGIHVKGLGSDPVGKFFQTFESAVLFPEFIARSVRQGMEERNILPQLTATVTRIDAKDYRAITSAPAAEDKALKRVEEGASIPQTAIRSQDNLVRLHKRGRMLVASYEAVKYQKLDLFAVTLRQIGSHIMQTHLQDAIDVILWGDGNSNPAPAASIPAASFNYAALLSFWSDFAPYEMNTLLAGRDLTLAVLGLPEFQNPLTGLNFQGTGKLDSPLGASLLRAGELTGTLIGLDKRYALEMVQSGDLTVEYDKLIDRQLERAAIVSTAGFAKIFPEAARVLTVA
ncbi:MAG: phage major capsid protein [Oscillospiraceae bacterium]|jgi:hypothetical protein|nr:phage major capsid protein [Oscillospiraceae bacterium]